MDTGLVSEFAGSRGKKGGTLAHIIFLPARENIQIHWQRLLELNSKRIFIMKKKMYGSLSFQKFPNCLISSSQILKLPYFILSQISVWSKTLADAWWQTVLIGTPEVLKIWIEFSSFGSILLLKVSKVLYVTYKAVKLI